MGTTEVSLQIYSVAREDHSQGEVRTPEPEADELEHRLYRTVPPDPVAGAGI